MEKLPLHNPTKPPTGPQFFKQRLAGGSQQTKKSHKTKSKKPVI